MTKIVRIGMVALLLSMGARAADFDPELIKDFAIFDRALVPAIVHAGEDSDALARSIGKLRAAWATFAERRADDIARNAHWGDTSEQILRIIENIDSTDSYRAYIQLVQVQSKLLSLRKTTGVSYFLDPITRFRDALDRTRPLIDTRARGAALAQSKIALEEWSKLRGMYFDKILYSFDYYKMGEFGMNLDMVRSSTDRLIEALTNNDLDAATEAFNDAQAASDAVYRLFGNFE